MPIFRINDQLHYFAHVPKCGGTSVETYLAQRFGQLAFYEPLPPTGDKARVWARTTGQHIPVSALDRLIPPEWLASSFAIVRHPVDRLISDFCFWRDNVKSIPPDADLDAWFHEAAARIRPDPYSRDGHLLPQSEFVPQAARIFRLEDRLDAIPAYIDSLTGTSDGPRAMPVEMVGRYREQGPPPTPSAATLARIAKVYAVDFERFGYDIADRAAARPRPPASGRLHDFERSTLILQQHQSIRQNDGPE
jgi:hypothetical protein